MTTAIKDFIVNEHRSEGPDDTLLPEQAAAYLGRLWGRVFTTKDFRNFRLNYSSKIADLGIEPMSRSPSITAWRRSDLDIIAKNIGAPRLREEVRKPRPSRRKS